MTSIYLNSDEIEKLYNLDLSENPKYDLTRDVFLVGCYTAQRFSDYSKIGKENIKELEIGKFVIELNQSKTGVKVIIPAKPELLQILRKYDYQLPKTYEQDVNENIKKVALKAEINEIIVIEVIKGGMRAELKRKKGELVKTHTARRSGCTNMYLAGIPVIDIMKISGHKTEKEFMKYIKVGKEETARNLLNHPYFTSQLKVVV